MPSSIVSVDQKDLGIFRNIPIGNLELEWSLDSIPIQTPPRLLQHPTLTLSE
jgi:hypothetical protein